MHAAPSARTAADAHAVPAQGAAHIFLGTTSPEALHSTTCTVLCLMAVQPGLCVVVCCAVCFATCCMHGILPPVSISHRRLLPANVSRHGPSIEGCSQASLVNPVILDELKTSLA